MQPEEIPNLNEDETSTKVIKKLNNWLTVLMIFMILYSIGMFIVIDQKTNKALQMHPVVMFDPNTMTVNSPAYTNLIHPIALRTNIPTDPTPSATNTPAKPMFEQRESYEVGDFVVINFFYVETIVIERLPNDQYRLMYKNHEHTLETIVLHKQFLLYPTSYNVVSPVSLLVD